MHGLMSSETTVRAQEVAERIATSGLRTVRLAVVDQHGVPRAKSLSPDAAIAAMSNGLDFSGAIYSLDTGNNVFVSPFAADGGFGIPEFTGFPDVVLVPDPATFRILPWANRTGWMLCDAYFSNGQPVPLDGRGLLRRQLAALAMYRPLDAIADAQSLLERKWPRAIDDVLTQQLREPIEERALRSSIAQLTAIEDDVSLRVQQQYEENPYPRWVHVAGNVEPLAIGDYLRSVLPNPVPPLALSEALEVLVAGCGTGSLPIEIARELLGCTVLAIDLSVSSLAYAKRKLPPELVGRIEFGQADILKLDALDRSFEIVDASGVLHHMADPSLGLRKLLALLRPDGLMHLGLYSELARRNITAARKYIAEKGYRPTPAEIRRARQDLANSDLRGLARAPDFYSTSECRDLLFHVQEQQLTIPQIKSLLADNALRFLGFAFDPMRARHYAGLFAQAGKSPIDLDAWQEFETRNTDTFAGMYQFWVQKPAA